jgi:hypothetical protein
MSNNSTTCRNIKLPWRARALAITGWLLALLVGGQVMAESPGVREEAAWYEGELVIRLAKLNDPDALDSPVKVPAAVQNPLYIVRSAGAVAQEHPVVGVVPRDPGYTGWWEQVLVLDVSGFFPGGGRNVGQNPYTSTAEIEEALCELKGGFPVFASCIAMGKPLVDISDPWLPENLGPLNAQIIKAPPTLDFCQSD